MAKAIATVTGVAIRPGVSANRRLYTAPVISAMVSGAQSAIEDGSDLSMLTHHGAGDESDRIVGRLTGMSLGEDGSARFTADLADTQHGRTLASLLDTSDGKPAFLKGVSIRGYWKGTVRKVPGPDGQPVETGDALTLAGLDYTRTPGVDGAQVDSFAWTRGGARSETTERVLITESVQEARVTAITEEARPDTPQAPAALSEAVLDILGAGHELDNGICVTCEAAESSVPMGQRGSGMTGGGKQYADPGYQDDKKQRYDLSSKEDARAAWSYISQGDNAKKYSANQLKRIRGRIMKALKKFGVSVAAESGWTVGEPVAVGEAVAEWWPGADPQTSGSYCLTASNGPTSLTISSCHLAPEDLDPVLRAAADAACKALAALDPDMDGDIDVPGAPGADTDHSMGRETAAGDDDEATETSPADEAGESAAPAADTEEEAVGDTTTTTEAAAGAPAAITLTTEQFGALLAQIRPQPAAETVTAPEPPAQPAAPAQPVTPAAPVPVAPAVPAQETADQRMARLTALADAKVAEAAAKAGLAVAESDEQIMERLIEERLTPLRQDAAERTGAGTARKGLLETIASQAPGSTKVLQEADGDDLAALAGAAYAPRA